jgi:predicted enzyme related to lactoylglutathione lyase
MMRSIYVSSSSKPTCHHFKGKLIVLNYLIVVKSIQEYSAKVEQLGGKVMVPKKPVPGMGYFAVCLDTENNSFGIWETDANAK